MAKDTFQVEIEFSQEETAEAKLLQIFEFVLNLNQKNENEHEIRATKAHK